MKTGFAGATSIEQSLLAKPRFVSFAECLSDGDIHLLCCYNEKVVNSLIIYQPCYPFIGFHVSPAKTENNDISMFPQKIKLRL